MEKAEDSESPAFTLRLRSRTRLMIKQEPVTMESEQIQELSQEQSQITREATDRAELISAAAVEGVEMRRLQEESDSIAAELVSEMTIEAPKLQGLKEEADSTASEDEQEPTPVPQIDYLEKSRCGFCLKLFQKNEMHGTNQETLVREKVEFVLSTQLDTTQCVCCRNCWRMFEAFYSFKKYCLQALPRLGQLSLVNAERLKPISCASCGTTISCLTCLERHKKNCKRKKVNSRAKANTFTCPVCNVVLKYAYSFKKHMANHEEPKLECKICKEKFFFRYKLEAHCKVCVIADEGIEEDPTSSIVKDPVLPKPCVTTFVKKEDLPTSSTPIVWIANDDNVASVDSELNVDEKGVQATQLKHDNTEATCKKAGKEFSCDRCEKSYTRPVFLKRHKETCGMPKLKVCHLCPAVFKEAKRLRYHMYKHEGIKPYKCQVEGCTKSFFSTDRRWKHEEYCRKKDRTINSETNKSVVTKKSDEVATGDNQNLCHLCPATFKVAKRLQYHLNRHNGVKPFPCHTEGCDKNFFNPTKRYHHMKTCGKTIQHVCNVCGETLKSTNTFRRHMATHGDATHECELCGKKFVQRGSLEKHLLICNNQQAQQSSNS